METVINLMIYLGIVLMLNNIIGYIKYQRYVKEEGIWERDPRILYIPILLLILFFLGYFGVVLFGNPGILIALILFGGSIFVFAMLQIMHIVTRRIRESDKLKADLEAAEKANVSKTVFLSSMSHDIRTPLNAIIGYTNLAKDNDDITMEQAQDYFSKIGASGRQLQELIDDILEMSRIESGKIKLDEEPEDLLAVMDEIRDMFTVQMQQKEMDYSVITDSVQDRFAVCDKTLIERIMLNLISNAYKYTEEGGKIKVELREAGPASDDRNTYEFRVSDNGIGMTKEFASRVFEAFEREKTSSVSGIQGTGLGMAITKNIVELMGGTIELITSPGQGTEIFVRLDLKPCDQSDVKCAGPVDDRSDISFEGSRVLLVDDVEMNREIAVMLLESMGFKADTAVNGEDAYNKVASSEAGYYNVILMDIQMPVMNGYEATEKIRSIDDPYISNIPIIALSANAFDEDKKKAKEAGMSGHISKPIDPEEMLTVLSDIVK